MLVGIGKVYQMQQKAVVVRDCSYSNTFIEIED